MDVLPKVEFHTPVVTVPTEARLVAEVILFCAAVPIVPYKFVPTKEVPCILPAAVNLPKDPVEEYELLICPLAVISPVIFKSSANEIPPTS